MTERENLRKCFRYVDFPAPIRERVESLRAAELPKPSSATSLSLSNAGVIKHDRHCKPSVANHIRFPELTPLSSFREFNNDFLESPPEVMTAINYLKEAFTAYYENGVNQATGNGRKGEDLKMEALFPHLSRIFQHECACSVTRPNSRLVDSHSGVDVGRVDFCVYIQGLGMPVFILELNKEVNSIQSEAIPQAATHYLEFAKCPSVPLLTVMPCVLMSCAGTDIHVSTAVLFDCHPPQHAACVQ